MDTALNVLATATVLLVWLAPAFLLGFCATCDGCSRWLAHLHLRSHGRVPPGAPSR